MDGEWKPELNEIALRFQSDEDFFGALFTANNRRILMVVIGERTVVVTKGLLELFEHWNPEKLPFSSMAELMAFMEHRPVTLEEFLKTRATR